jgi:hypothetical protein
MGKDPFFALEGDLEAARGSVDTAGVGSSTDSTEPTGIRRAVVCCL